ncbi:VOC family protein [Amycolatopsis australiensis]|uniref:Glyoxalase/Bleomycin resistance protein/Dioxygenase superfamily protein n=1 Tax=Amycolatopsis australiensis TaxID=546364 RepID=A0A1K1SAF8_9PSEU|nr:VOC family protein [Amycolatopsis australiensis]SFW81063.1 Glyoxalase/Bleomycin resistance protein/Dioxygenase superfamily protein [Amycolatopsis australiensis]
MSIFRLNHAVLYVRDLAESVAFYRDVLGFDYIEGGDAHRGAAFLRAPGSANDHDLGLFELGARAADPGAGKTSVGLYHLAWEVDTLGDLEQLAGRLAAAGALVGSSDHGTTKSLYAKDPDGLEFEVVWLIPRELLTDEDRAKSAAIGRLDLAAELAKYGPGARSGVGISRA